MCVYVYTCVHTYLYRYIDNRDTATPAPSTYMHRWFSITNSRSVFNTCVASVNLVNIPANKTLRYPLVC